VLASGDGTPSGDADRVHPVVAWEIAPLRAAALRTERAVFQRWQTARAAIIGGAVLLGVIGSAAALSLVLNPTLPSGVGFLSAADPSSASSTLTAEHARDGVAVASPQSPAPTGSAAGDDEPATEPQPAPVAAGSASEPEPEAPRGTPTADPQPAPVPTSAPSPSPSPSPPASTADDGGGLLSDLIDILVPGLLP
jgi:hypothetical protein